MQDLLKRIANKDGIVGKFDRLRKKAMQAFTHHTEAEGEALFERLTKGLAETSKGSNTYKLANGMKISKHLSAKAGGMFTIEIKINGIRHKIRFIKDVLKNVTLS